MRKRSTSPRIITSSTWPRTRMATAASAARVCRSIARNRSAVDLRNEFGDIDIYVFDQLLKGRIRPGDRVLDAGCGSGRNLMYLLKSGIDVWAVDSNPHAIGEVKELAARFAPSTPSDRFAVAPLQ